MAFFHGIEILELDNSTRAVQAQSSSTIGIVGTATVTGLTFPDNTPILVTSLDDIVSLSDTGTLKDAIKAVLSQTNTKIVAVRVDEDASPTATEANVLAGVNALLNAQSKLGFTPRILCAPSHTGAIVNNQANKIATALIAVAEKLRAVAILDSTNDSDVNAKACASLYDSSRAYMIDPYIFSTVDNGALPPSGFVAGLIAKIDTDEGFWVSPSNRSFNNVIGLKRPINFNMSDATSSANLLNEAKVATIINEVGFKLWGNRTLSSDAKWQFLSVRRTADIINDSLLNAHLWAVDRNITSTYTEQIVEAVNAFLRSLIARGAILGGQCWVDKEINTTASIAAGQVYFDFDFAPAYPAERITFRSALNNNYLDALVS